MSADPTVESSAPGPPAAHDVEEEWEGDGDDYEEEGGDDDVDAQAEAVARHLGDQLLAQIGQAFASATPPPPAPATTPAAPPPATPQAEVEADEDPLIATISTILAHAAANPEVEAALSSTPIPEADGASLLKVLKDAVTKGGIDPELAEPLSVLLATLAEAEVFATAEEPVPAPSTTEIAPPVTGKRKRDAQDEGENEQRPQGVLAPADLNAQLKDAISAITRALSENASKGPLDPALISSIQSQLHQVFLFSITSAGSGGASAPALHEISALIQVLGVLSGIPITGPRQPPPPPPPTYGHPPWPPPPPPHTYHGWSQFNTVVYPCQVPGCGKTFSKANALRSHHNTHETERPFKCRFCPASFARNHDLKRHVKGHDKKVFKCLGCNKTFTRRDALRRHKNNPKCPVECSQSGDEIVETDGEVVSRSERFWGPAYTPEPELEDGELHHDLVSEAQAAVTNLHALLQGHVAQALEDHGKTGTVDASKTPSAGSDAQKTKENGTEGSSSAPLGWNLGSLSGIGLNEEQTNLVQQAIAAAQAQAEAEAEALLDEEEEEEYDEEGLEGDLDQDTDAARAPSESG